MRVGVIHGGTSTEHDVSLASGRGILDALERLGHRPVPVLIGRDGTWQSELGRGQPAAVEAVLGCDVVVPALHGTHGEDGTVQGLLEMLAVPYVGSGVQASALCLDKALTKIVVGAAGVRVARHLQVDRERVHRLAHDPEHEVTALQAELERAGVTPPFFVKPVHGGSSIGVTRVDTPDGLSAALAAAGDDTVLLEEELVGLEVDVPVLESPGGELRCGPSLLVRSDPSEPFFTEAAKYASSATRFTVPAPVPEATTAALEHLALASFRALGCRGLARVDFFVTDSGIVLNEVNTFPGFTPASQFPRMWAAAGLAYDALVEHLVTTAASGRAVITPEAGRPLARAGR